MSCQLDELSTEIMSFYGETFSLTPLAAKIYTLLILDFERSGFSFEELMAKTCASKSSVSENLKLLTERQLISSTLKNEGRKRYFLINNNYVNVRFNEILNRINREISIIQQLREIIPDKDESTKTRLEVFQTMLQSNAETIEDTLKKF